jgi:GMP synthase (glutamine-hydrolysing)
MSHDTIVVIDFGSQYNHLITRRIRDLGVYSVLMPHNTTYDQIKEISNVKGVILSGGPNSVYQKESFIIEDSILSSELPILGICYGMQVLVQQLGGTIKSTGKKEYGKNDLIVSSTPGPLFDSLPSSFSVFMSHGDEVVTLPDCFIANASSQSCRYAAIQHHTKPLFGVQFHPEVIHTTHGNDILNRFISNICNANKTWQIEDYITRQIIEIQSIVGKKNVLLGLSGGVDSSVVALLIHKAIGHQLTCMFVDHGLLRKEESKEVMNSLANHFDLQVVRIDAKVRFLNALKGITDPEQKRKIIGNEFIRVFEEESSKLGNFDFLAQGTLYTDIVESGTSSAATIKSHHNVGGLPKEMKLKLLEPLNKLFKDEVRELGLSLGMPQHLINRQPFPGPGLAIRIMGEVTDEKLSIVQETDKILQEEINRANLNPYIWQYFTVLSGVKTVGVMGDFRTYDYTIAIRAVTSIDGMTADWAKIPFETLDVISRRMVNEVQGINRVVYDITSKPPATIEWE